MTTGDFSCIRREFVDGARLAREAGFDAVEIHMGHGYLLSQFLSPVYNRRTDDYGGSQEKRARFPVQVLEAVLDAVGRTTAVICKISMFEGHKHGGTVDDAIVTVRALSAAGAHLIVLSAGMNVESPWTIFGSPMPRGATPNPDSWLMRMGGQILQWRQPKVVFRDLRS